jgi:hypothetical protein
VASPTSTSDGSLPVAMAGLPPSRATTIPAAAQALARPDRPYRVDTSLLLPEYPSCVILCPRPLA